MNSRICPSCGGTCEAAFCPNDGAKVECDPYIGMVVARDVVLLELLGVGATGRVYRGFQRSVSRQVAVKILRRDLTKHAGVSRRFQREARIASGLRHPNVVEIYDAGELGDESMYITMEYLDGTTLARELESDSLMSIERVLGILLPLSDALGEAHAHAIVHRDIKPENVMLVARADAQDWVKVLDFGLAKDDRDSPASMSLAGAIFGTPRYISPEAVEGARLLPASDVYSLAVIAFEMLAGVAPFEAEESIGYFCKHMGEAAPDVRIVAKRHVPEALAAVVMRNLAKKPADRAIDARAFGHALAAAAKADGIAIPNDGAVARLSHSDLHSSADLEVSAPIPLAPLAALAPLPPRASRTRRLGLAVAFALGAIFAWLGVMSLGHLRPLMTSRSV